MPAKYSEDLRWRAVWLHLIRGLSVSEIADVLFVCKRSAEKYLSLYHATGSVAPRYQQLTGHDNNYRLASVVKGAIGHR